MPAHLPPKCAMIRSGRMALLFWIVGISTSAFSLYDPFNPVPFPATGDNAGLFRQMNLDTQYIEKTLAFLHRSHVVVPALRVTLARGEDFATYQLRGMTVGLYGKRFWVGYEYVNPTEVIATMQWQVMW